MAAASGTSTSLERARSLWSTGSGSESDVGEWSRHETNSWYRHPSLQVADCAGTGVGVEVCPDSPAIDAGTLLLAVPRARQLHVDTYRGGVSFESGDAETESRRSAFAALDAMERGDRADPWNALVLRILLDWSHLTLLAPPLRSYLESLPVELDQPVTWSRTQRAALLRGCSMLQHIAFQDLLDEYRFKIVPFVAQQHSRAFDPSVVTESLYLRVACWLMSRAFRDAEQRLCLCPAVDLLNTAPAPHVNCRLEWSEQGTLRIVSTRVLSAGEQVFLSYGEDASSNTQWLERYGFALPPSADVDSAEVTTRLCCAVVKHVMAGSGGVAFPVVAASARKGHARRLADALAHRAYPATCGLHRAAPTHAHVLCGGHGRGHGLEDDDDDDDDDDDEGDEDDNDDDGATAQQEGGTRPLRERLRALDAYVDGLPRASFVLPAAVPGRRTRVPVAMCTLLAVLLDLVEPDDAVERAILSPASDDESDDVLGSLLTRADRATVLDVAQLVLGVRRAQFDAAAPVVDTATMLRAHGGGDNVDAVEIENERWRRRALFASYVRDGELRVLDEVIDAVKRERERERERDDGDNEAQVDVEDEEDEEEVVVCEDDEQDEADLAALLASSSDAATAAAKRPRLASSAMIA